MKTDFDDLIAGGSLPPCDHVYICLGTTMKKAGSKDAFWKVDFEYCIVVAKKAREAGATTLSLVSSVGANAESNNFYLHTKGALENTVTALGFPTVNIYRPSMLSGKRTERRPLEALGVHLFKATGPLFIGGFRKYRGINVELLAATMVENATSTHVPKGINYFYFNEIGPNLPFGFVVVDVRSCDMILHHSGLISKPDDRYCPRTSAVHRWASPVDQD